MTFNMANRFYQHFSKDPQRRALVVNGEDYSYDFMARLAGQISAWLYNKQGDQLERVGVLASRSLEAYAGVLGTCWAGSAFVPMNPKNPENRLLRLIERSNLDCLIIGPGVRNILSEKILSVCPKDILSPCEPSFQLHQRDIQGKKELEKLSPMEKPRPMAAEKMAYMIFTSGTTGEPKGVMVSQENFDHLLTTTQKRYQITPDDRLSQHSELTFDVAVLDIFMAWGAGASLHVVPPNMAMAPASFIRKQELTVWFSVPSVVFFMNRMKLLKPNSFPSLRLSLLTGEPLPKISAEQWRIAAPNSRIDNLYGPTEATVECLWQPYVEPYNITPSRGFVAIGRAYDGLHAEIIDSAGKFLPFEETGELVISGPQVTAGYWQDSELTARKFPTLDHPELGKTRWYKTGDLCYKDSSGACHYLGRIDHQIKVLGNRVELEEIEAHLRNICQRDSVAAVAWPIQNGSAQGIYAFISGVSLEPKAIKEGLQKQVPSYMIPRKIISLEALPLNLSGKIDRKALVRMLEEQEN